MMLVFPKTNKKLDSILGGVIICNQQDSVGIDCTCVLAFSFAIVFLFLFTPETIPETPP